MEEFLRDVFGIVSACMVGAVCGAILAEMMLREEE
jgi:hypothetical protein